MRRLGVLVETGGKADRIRKRQPKHSRGKQWIVRMRVPQRRVFERPQGQRMGILGIEYAQERSGDVVEQANHGQLHNNFDPRGLWSTVKSRNCYFALSLCMSSGQADGDAGLPAFCKGLNKPIGWLQQLIIAPI